MKGLVWHFLDFPCTPYAVLLCSSDLCLLRIKDGLVKS